MTLHQVSLSNSTISPSIARFAALRQWNRIYDRDTGIEELTAATGWLPHTTRAALTGLRKRGYVLARERREGADTVYRILSAPHAQAA
jgi:hypothetical protein